MSIYTMVYLRKIKQQIEEEEEREVLRKTTLNLSQVLLEKRILRLPDQSQNSLTFEKKIRRSFAFILWNFLSQLLMTFILCKSLAHRPNIMKTVIMIIWMTYVIKLFRGLAQGLRTLRIFEVLDSRRTG